MVTTVLDSQILGEVKLYKRGKVCNFMLDSNAYTRAQERNNHCIRYHYPNQQSFGLIEHFLRIKTTDSRVHVVAVINKLDDMQKSLSSDQITEATAAHVITVQL